MSLTPGSGEPLEWWLGGAVVLVALAGLPLIVVYTHRAATRASRQQPRRGAARRAAVRRLVAEATAIALAVGGLIVLREQGLHTAGGDIYPRTAPVLVAIPTGELDTATAVDVFAALQTRQQRTRGDHPGRDPRPHGVDAGPAHDSDT